MLFFLYTMNTSRVTNHTNPFQHTSPLARLIFKSVESSTEEISDITLGEVLLFVGNDPRPRTSLLLSYKIYRELANNLTKTLS